LKKRPSWNEGLLVFNEKRETMPSGKHQVELQLPITEIWNFVKDMDNWAPLIPNYIYHEKLTDRKSIWEFKSDFGLIKTKMNFLIDIKEWNEPTRVSFELKSKNERFTGKGYFEAQEIQQQKTRLTGFLEVQANGKLGPTVNSKLETALPQYVEEMAQAISTKLEEIKRV